MNFKATGAWDRCVVASVWFRLAKALLTHSAGWRAWGQSGPERASAPSGALIGWRRQRPSPGDQPGRPARLAGGLTRDQPPSLADWPGPPRIELIELRHRTNRTTKSN